MSLPLKAPFPYFGGKSRAAELIWARFGNVVNYCEPFFGSGAVLLRRPRPFAGSETVNDINAYLANFWRALQQEPESVAMHASSPVNEVDLHARHLWLVNREDFRARMMTDPEYYDVKIAGWWVWGLCCWIGSGWCDVGSYERNKNTRPDLSAAGRGVHRKRPDIGNSGKGVHRKLVHLGDAGRGINRQLPHLGDAGQGINRQLPHLGNAGRGINRQLPHLGNAGQGILDYFYSLTERLRRVRVCCGDWRRVLGPSVTFKHGLTAVFLDPPYAVADRAVVYSDDDRRIARDVRDWAIDNGENRLLRICLAGYEDEHEMPDNWECVKWRPRGGYDGQNRDKDNQNRERERLWFSPHCVRQELPLFAEAS